MKVHGCELFARKAKTLEGVGRLLIEESEEKVVFELGPWSEDGGSFLRASS